MDEGTRSSGTAVTLQPVESVVVDSDAMVIAAFDTYQARLNGYAYAATHDADLAEDLVAEAFARLVVEVRAGRAPLDVGAWLYRVCGNLAISRGRRQSVARRWVPFLVDRRTGRSPEEAAISQERDETLLAALDQLPRDARVALLMAAEGRSRAEIGETIGRTELATRAFICRARIRLREILGDEEATA